MSRLSFTKDLHQFLKTELFTHIQLRGIEPKTAINSQTENQDDYILIPWKEDILLFNEADWKIEEINSSEVADMLDVEFGVYFFVELSNEMAEKYKAQASQN